LGTLRFSIKSDEIFSIPPFADLNQYLAIEFRGMVPSESGLCLMVETISRNIPAPPVGVELGGYQVEEILDQWNNASLNHRLLVCRLTESELFKGISEGAIVPAYGTNLSSNGMVVQLIGRGGELSQFLEGMRQILPVSKVTTTLNQVVVQQSLLESDIEKTLQTAHDLGFYQNPKNTSLRELSKRLGMSKSSVSNHLRAAENRLVEKYLDDR